MPRQKRPPSAETPTGKRKNARKTPSDPAPARKQKWVKSTADVTIPIEVRAKEMRDQVEAAQKRVFHQVAVRQEAELDYMSPGTMSPGAQAYVVRSLWRSKDPEMRRIAWMLLVMLRPRKSRMPRKPKGRHSEAERDARIAFLMHREIVRMRAKGEPGHGIKMKAARIVRRRLVAKNPGKRFPKLEQLVEIYGEHEARLLKKWPEIEADLAAVLRS